MKMHFRTLAIGLLLLLPATAQSTIIYSGTFDRDLVASVSTPGNGNQFDTFNLDVDGNSVTDLIFRASARVSDMPGDEILPGMTQREASAFLLVDNGSRVVTDSGLPAMLALGVSIDSSLTYTGTESAFVRTLGIEQNTEGFVFRNGNWTDASTGYLGFSLEIDSATHYGWMQIEFTDVTAPSGIGTAIADYTLIDYAYESTVGQAIQTGAIPESSTSLLVLTGLILTACRRRRGV